MSINDLSPYWGNGRQSEPTESYDAYSHVPTVTQDQWSLNSLEALAPGLVTPSVSKNAATPSLQCSSTTASTEGHGDRTNVVATDMSQDPTTMSQRGNALADDERFIRRSEEELREDQDRRMEYVWGVIEWIAWEGDCRDSLKEHQLWLSIIEGNVDDVWLWVDGDEEWLTKCPFFFLWNLSLWLARCSVSSASSRHPAAISTRDRKERKSA
ncbi:hypothetical protein EV401DRAFT_154293 [Pisolithus croceorrhizus]|nr:hypothetical protein EV401DRAFT_154293 [Pisolithus croceorrhizus]